MRKIIPGLLLCLFLCSCTEISKPETDLPDSTQNDPMADVPLEHRVTYLLGDAGRADTFEHMSKAGEEFLFMRSVHLSATNEKQVVEVHEVSPSAVAVNVHYRQGGGWMHLRNYVELHMPGPAFNVIVEDFNFDGRKDVFVVESVSNGYAMSRGHLFTTDSSQMTRYFLTLHEEVSTISNPAADPGKRVMTSDSLIWCKGIETVCKTEFTWADSVFVRGKTFCPCEGD